MDFMMINLRLLSPGGCEKALVQMELNETYDVVRSPCGRAQPEGRVSIQKNGFLGRPMRSKGFVHRHSNVGWRSWPMILGRSRDRPRRLSRGRKKPPDTSEGEAITKSRQESFVFVSGSASWNP
jgi:hypothetical protein